MLKLTNYNHSPGYCCMQQFDINVKIERQIKVLYLIFLLTSLDSPQLYVTLPGVKWNKYGLSMEG